MTTNKPSSCPLCGADTDRQTSASAAVYGAAGEHQVWHCTACDVRHLYPGLSAEDEMRFYAKEFEKFMQTRSAEGAGWESPQRHVAANQDEARRRLSYLRPLLPVAGSRALEFGCSSGFLLKELADAGLKCTGVEPSGIFSPFVRSQGFACYESLDALAADGAAREGFDLITHFYVLEHIRDADAFLQRQYDLLRPGGKLIFEVPHALDALAALYDIKAYHRFIWVISHRWYFTKPSLSHLLARLGGKHEVRYDQRYDLSNHLVWLRDGKPGGMARFTEALGTEIESQYKVALVEAGYGDTLIGIVTKPA